MDRRTALTDRLITLVLNVAFGALLIYVTWQLGRTNHRIDRLEISTWPDGTAIERIEALEIRTRSLDYEKASLHNLHAWQDNELEDRLWKIESRLTDVEAREAATDSVVAFEAHRARVIADRVNKGWHEHDDALDWELIARQAMRRLRETSPNP